MKFTGSLEPTEHGTLKVSRLKVTVIACSYSNGQFVSDITTVYNIVHKENLVL